MDLGPIGMSTRKERSIVSLKERSRSEPLFLNGVHASNTLNGILIVLVLNPSTLGRADDLFFS